MVPSSEMFGIFDQIGILDCAAIGWKLLKQTILADLSLYSNLFHLTDDLSHQFHRNVGLQWYKLVVS